MALLLLSDRMHKKTRGITELKIPCALLIRTYVHDLAVATRCPEIHPCTSMQHSQSVCPLPSSLS